MVAVAVVVGIFLLLGGVGLGWGLVKANILGSSAHVGPIQTVPQQGSSIQSGQGIDAQAVASKVEPAIVDINTLVQTTGRSIPAARPSSCRATTWPTPRPPGCWAPWPASESCAA